MTKPSPLAARTVAAAFATALVLSSAGCNSKPVGSCDWRPVGGNRCFEFTAGEAAEGKQTCDDGRRWSDKPCELSGSIGGCKMIGGITKWLYPGDDITTRESARIECDNVWLEPRR